jgi:hypothetical protein
MLQDAAGCGKLRVLEVNAQGRPGGRLWPDFTGQGLAKLADGLSSSALEMCGVQVWDRHVQLAAVVAELVCRLPALQEGTFRVQWEGAVEMAGQAESDEVARARVQHGQLLERLRAMGLL